MYLHAHGHWCAFTDLYHTTPYHTILYHATHARTVGLEFDICNMIVTLLCTHAHEKRQQTFGSWQPCPRVGARVRAQMFYEPVRNSKQMVCANGKGFEVRRPFCGDGLMHGKLLRAMVPFVNMRVGVCRLVGPVFHVVGKGQEIACANLRGMAAQRTHAYAFTHVT